MKQIAGGRSLTNQAATSIREAVLSGELRPGHLYSVTQLAQDLKISRTPVREALLGLADAGLVRIERNRGFRVVEQDASHVAEVFELRLLLEVPAAGSAAKLIEPDALAALENRMAAMRKAATRGDERQFVRHDRAFHDQVLAAAGNSLLMSIVGELRDTINSLGASTVPRSRSLDDIAAEHAPILTALAARDRRGAATAMRLHLEHTRDLLLRQLLG